MGASLLISMLSGVCLALVCIRNPKADRVIFNTASFVTEIPSYLIGVLLLFLVAAKVKWIPLSGAVTAFARYDSTWDWIRDVLVHALMPVSAMCIFTIPKFFFTARASFRTVAGKPYLLNAKAKGLSERRIRWRYIFVNAITPVIARLFLSVGTTIGATMLIENVFAYPGVGTVMREAVKYRDYILIQDIFLLSTVIVLLSLFAADLLNGFVDREEH
jgi:peptide/nickel transport system permease protein